MKVLLFFVAVLILGQLAYGQPPRTGKKPPGAPSGYVPTGSDADPQSEQKAFVVNDGSRINLEDRGFSIQPPPGWEVLTEHPQLSLVMQIPYEKGMKYQRTIQVATSNDPKYIDATTAKDFEKEIVRKFSRASGGIEDYRIRNHLDVEMGDGRPGILFYSEFILEGVPLMQMHVLVSSETRHYLMTFTDVAEHFEDDGSSVHLTAAWESLISVQLDTATPSRFGIPLAVGAGLAVLVALFGFFQFIRKRKAGQDFDRYSTGAGLDDVPEVSHQETFVVPKTAELETMSDEGLPDATMAETPLEKSKDTTAI